jgi:hypothetical protein
LPIFRGVLASILTCAIAVLAAAQTGGSDSHFRVDESHVKFRLKPKPVLEIPIVSSAPGTIAYRLELLDTNDHAGSSKAGTFVASKGAFVQKIDWPLQKLAEISPSNLGWHRIRYSLQAASGGNETKAEGTIQLNRVMIGLFQVRITAGATARPGSKFPVRVLVDDPKSGKPLRGAKVDFELESGDDADHAGDKAPMTHQSAITDFSGYAVTTFNLPGDTEAEEGTVTATVHYGDLEEDANLQFRLVPDIRMTLSTDKPLYQPSQVAHLRVLALAGGARKALADRNVEVTVADSEGNEQLHQVIRTSRFGVANVDWSIPEKSRLGDYLAKVELKETEESRSWDTMQATANLRISRYELPSFTVSAEPDQTYYLPGQQAKVVIRADYLFGQPVRNAAVRLVQQESRRWDFKLQKWEVEESRPLEGRTDAYGKSVASVDLKDEFASFDPNDYEHYQDLTLAAYVTDPSTKRTEQRRFRIRLTQQPIHVYVISGAETARAPDSGTIFVTASYADGTPASANGTLYFAEPSQENEFDKAPWQSGRTRALGFHTNRYGVAKVVIPQVRDRFLIRPRPGPYSSFQSQPPRNALLLLEVKDGQGRFGRKSETWAVRDEEAYLQVETPQVLFHPGDKLPVSLRANRQTGDVVVHLSTASGLVKSQVVRLVDGRAETVFDYDLKLRGDVEIVAFAMRGFTDWRSPLTGIAHVIYPERTDLQVGVQMARTTYRPGETASADIRVRTSTGSSVESALGVLVYDRAVAERVRSDEESSRSYGFSAYDYNSIDNIGSLAGIGLPQLLSLDANAPYSPDLQVVADALMHASERYWSWSPGVQIDGGEDYVRGASSVYEKWIERSLASVKKAVKSEADSEGDQPQDLAGLEARFARAGIEFQQLRDPWGVPYRAEFSIRGAQRVLSVISSGPDKTASTEDDIVGATFQWSYFRPEGRRLDSIVRNYATEEGHYIRDNATLSAVMRKEGLDLDKLRDPWGHPYQFGFEIRGAQYAITVKSAGPDGIFDSRLTPSWDDVSEWTTTVRYFAKEGAELERALADHVARTGRFPQNDADLQPILESAHLTGERLLDPWGRPYHFVFSQRSRYWDRINITSYADYVTSRERRDTEAKPVTQELAYLTVYSYGEQNQPDFAFNIAEFSRVLTEIEAGKDLKRTASTQGPLPAGSGAIAGTITDPSGAAIAKVKVIAISATGQSTVTYSGDEGAFAIPGIAAGEYDLRFESPGFQVRTIARVPVKMGSATKLDVQLSVGSVSETVTVEAAATVLQTESASIVSKTVPALQGTPGAEKPLFTPRLRKYFPETLLWKPEVITNARGQAHIEFPMADNITAWSMSVIASTEGGQIGVAQKELRTFQPFFIEHDPPKVLTQGDEISLPAVLRNYSGRSQSLLTEISQEPWFTLLSAARQTVKVDAGGDARAEFRLRTTSSTRAGKQTVRARNSDTGDAVEREVRVHPDGREYSITAGRLLTSAQRELRLDVPPGAIPGSMEAEIRIYPNLLAHVLDAMRGIGRKPTGCVEQVTSAAYVSLHALQLLKKQGGQHKEIEEAAGKSVREAYAILTSRQAPDGAFAYWSSSDADSALTAYAARFLASAQPFVDGDASPILKARAYLSKKQTQSGAWQRYDWLTKSLKDDAPMTAYIARALAASGDDFPGNDHPMVEGVIGKALTYLDDRLGEWTNPYLAGNYALAASAIHHEGHMSNARELLGRLAHQEGANTYWDLNSNTMTPFYGWGLAGRLETTALAVEALARMQTSRRDPADEELVQRGLQYLLAHKDRDAIWYSTQATQNVLEAIIAAMPPPAQTASGPQPVSVFVNGARLTTIALPDATAVAGPVVAEIDGALLKPGSNVAAIEGGQFAALQANLSMSYYMPWDRHQQQETLVNDGSALRLSADFDKRETKTGELVTCRVGIERIGFRGYGMLIAEIGLPPGAEVDRESIEEAREHGVNEYEVLPDRVVVYVWPQAGRMKFEFGFRPRFGLKALSASSTLYDYYNPDMRAAVAPVLFRVD